MQVLSMKDILFELDYLCVVYFFLCFIYKTVLAGFSVQEQLAADGILWFPDLTALDSTWILPISVGIINLLIVEVSGFKWDLCAI